MPIPGARRQREAILNSKHHRGCLVRKVFISYARQNRPDIDQLVEHLRVLGCDTWVDASLHGGQDWWEEILRRIADCDTFIATISREALNCTG